MNGLSLPDEAGQFMLILQRATLLRLASDKGMSGTAEEIKAVVQDSIAYFGTCAIDEASGTISYVVRVVTGSCPGKAAPGTVTDSATFRIRSCRRPNDAPASTGFRGGLGGAPWVESAAVRRTEILASVVLLRRAAGETA